MYIIGSVVVDSATGLFDGGAKLTLVGAPVGVLLIGSALGLFDGTLDGAVVRISFVLILVGLALGVSDRAGEYSIVVGPIDELVGSALGRPAVGWFVDSLVVGSAVG